MSWQAKRKPNQGPTSNAVDDDTGIPLDDGETLYVKVVDDDNIKVCATRSACDKGETLNVDIADTVLPETSRPPAVTGDELVQTVGDDAGERMYTQSSVPVPGTGSGGSPSAIGAL